MTVDDCGFNYQTDNPNCDDGFEPTDYYDAGRWHAFTGFSGGWYEEVMDLNMFAGHEIELYFTYWTDPYYEEAGWYIDDINITLADPFFDDVEDEEHGWTVSTGWQRSNILYDNIFTVNFIEYYNEFSKSGELILSSYVLSSMNIDHEDETEQKDFLLMDVNGLQSYVVMMVTNQPGFEHTFGTTYSFAADVLKADDQWWKWRWENPNPM